MVEEVGESGGEGKGEEGGIGLGVPQPVLSHTWDFWSSSE